MMGVFQFAGVAVNTVIFHPLQTRTRTPDREAQSAGSVRVFAYSQDHIFRSRKKRIIGNIVAIVYFQFFYNSSLYSNFLSLFCLRQVMIIPCHLG